MCRFVILQGRFALAAVCFLTFFGNYSLAKESSHYIAPNNFKELEQRIEEVGKEYAPYLRSLPKKAEARRRETLNGNWKFTFEVKDPPRNTKAVPVAPNWFTFGFDDSKWESTTVPEWRYRTRGHDNAYDLKTLDAWVGYRGDRTTSQICWYRRTFTVEKSKADQRQWLCFDGVDWEAQVYLNGKLLGTHRTYYEPFRFDVTDHLKLGENQLAVRVIDGREYGEPMTYWAQFPDIRAESQRYTPKRSESIKGNRPIGYHAGTGFGIWRDVYLETTGRVRVDNIFARNDLSSDTARIKIELNSATARSAKLHVQVMPENCDGPAYEQTLSVDLPIGASIEEVVVPMPNAKSWSPETPNLYRCRVTIDEDSMDVLFGCRSFTVINHEHKMPVYQFQPVKSRWLRIVGRASDQSSWNSITEIRSPAILREPNTVSSSGSHKDYPASLAFDGNEKTRWAVDGNHWIQCRLDPTIEIKELGIGWYEGNQRKWDFDLLVSEDGKEWTKLLYQQAVEGATGHLPNGLLMLNGQPCFMRGTNVQGLNAYAYWGETDQLVHAIHLLKAGNFNAVRVCQHSHLPQVREMLDRLGIMSEQEQGGGYHHSLPTVGLRAPQHTHAGTVLARETYNNPGVVLLTFGNEHRFEVEPVIRAVLAVDPQRIVKPISGRYFNETMVYKPLVLPKDLWPNVIDDSHDYQGWYGKVPVQTWKWTYPRKPKRLRTVGEFGIEAMDSYESMKTYPSQFAPPPADTDTVWATSQVKKHDHKQIVGLGRKPTNLAEYIEASQNYQEACLADKIIGYRLYPRTFSGYFHFHFMDVVPAFWPKSIVSHDHRPKKAYYQIAQINQPVVVLPRLIGPRPNSMVLWVCNDLDQSFDGATVTWTVSHRGKRLIEGSRQLDVKPINATEVATIDLKPVTWKHLNCQLRFSLANKAGELISHYNRQLRCVPKQLLNKDIREQVEDPFNLPAN